MAKLTSDLLRENINYMEIKKMEKFDDAVEQNLPVENIPAGSFVKRNEKAKRVYVRESYCQSAKRYVLTAWDDANFHLYVKKGTGLFSGFEF